jgi:two-component sensor histidine kinase
VVSDLRQEPRFSGPPLLLEHAVISGMSTIIPGPDGEPYGVLGVHTRRQRNFTRYDVNFLRTVANILGGAVQKAHAIDVQALLYHELRHRVSNLFAQMLSIHRQTAKACGTIDELVEGYERRLAQTAVAHDAISRQDWSTTSWKGLLETLLASFGGQVELSGPPTVISADHAFALSFVINELATNAAKHGALATDTGRLTVRWDIQTDPERRLIIDWHELAARPIAAPGRTSFGTRLIDMMVKQRLQGEITRKYGEEGLQLRISLPFAADAVTGRLQMASGD